jgi:hypothetical protein
VLTNFVTSISRAALDVDGIITGSAKPAADAESVVPLIVKPEPTVISCGSPAPLADPRPTSLLAADTFCIFAYVTESSTKPAVGNPVQFVSVPLAGVPIAGVTSVGLLANTKAPEPVSSVTAEIKFADDGVARNVATFVPSPETSLAILTVRVLFAPLIVLLVKVCVPVSVATVESIATVTAEDPLYDVPERPVPIVKALRLLPSVTPDIVDAANFDTAIAAEAFISAFKIAPSAIIVEVMVPVSPLVIIFPVTFGIVIVASCTGSTTVIVV